LHRFINHRYPTIQKNATISVCTNDTNFDFGTQIKSEQSQNYYKHQLSLTNPRDALHPGKNVLPTNKVDAQRDKLATELTLRVESRQFSATALAFNLAHLHLAPRLGATPIEFC